MYKKEQQVMWWRNLLPFFILTKATAIKYIIYDLLTVNQIKKETGMKEQVKLSSLSGLGSEIWKNLNIDKYLEI